MLTFGFGLLLTLLLLLIFTGLSKANLPPDLRKKYVRVFAGGAALWLMYVATLGASDFFQDVAAQGKRIHYFLRLPALIFVLAIALSFYYRKNMEALIQGVPPAWPVYLQGFRVAVELLIWGVYLKTSAGIPSAFPSLNILNLLIGLSAPAVAYWGYQRRLMPVQVLQVWNILALFYMPAFWWHISGANFHPEYGTMPYLLIPAVFQPLGMFVSMFSLRQLQTKVVAA